ncbi:hypothetical protein SNF32_02730 [Enterococcus mundtii]|nr:hypothetical protein [Enterococcus mundtii]
MGTVLAAPKLHRSFEKEQPRIKSATIGFSSVNTFDLSVTEYKEIALILTDGKYSPVIEDGTVLDEIVESPTKICRS